MRAASIPRWSSASMPASASKISPLTASTAFDHALALVARLVAVAQLDRLVGAGGGARRDRRPAHGPVLEHDVDLDRRVAAAVEDLAADDVDDGGHGHYLESCGHARARGRVRRLLAALVIGAKS